MTDEGVHELFALIKPVGSRVFESLDFKTEFLPDFPYSGLLRSFAGSHESCDKGFVLF